jgi:hypothetical protein
VALFVPVGLRRVIVVGIEKGLGGAIAGTLLDRRATRPIRGSCAGGRRRARLGTWRAAGARAEHLRGDLLDESAVLVGGGAGEQELS